MERGKQPPLVDSTACLCRVDAGLKTTIISKNFVKGSKLCTQSSIKPSIHPSNHHQPPPCTSGDRRTRGQSPLLPGLPDDLAIACLIRAPRSEHRKLRLVCKRWSRLLSGNYFYSLRKSHGLSEQWIHILKRDKEGRISWDAFDPVHHLWHPLPPVPADYSSALGFGCAVLSGCHLYLFGGKDPIKGSMRRVVFYSARTNRWHRAPDMLRRRHFFGACVLNNCIHVAGGEGEGGQRCLRSAEVYDPRRGAWSFAAEMTAAMVPFIGVVYEGRWYLKGLGASREVLGEVYLPEKDGWLPVFDGMVAGWRNPSACLEGRLYAVDCKDGCRLRVYDEETDSWRRDLDSGVHLGWSRAVEAAGMVAVNGKLCVVRNDMSISMVDVAGRRWEVVAGKGLVRTFVTNLWSSIAGPKRLKSHIVHCQVLEA